MMPLSITYLPAYTTVATAAVVIIAKKERKFKTMPNIGLSQMFVAKRNYNESDNTASYAGGIQFGRAVNFTTEITVTENSNFYADNDVAESMGGEFQSGTLTTETAEIPNDVSVMILGLATRDVAVGETTATELLYGSGSVPELGFGVVKKRRVNGVDKWQAIILPRISFNAPGDATKTEGETVEWQTETATATIMREQQAREGDKRWKLASIWETEELAAEYVKQFLSVGAGA